MLWIKILFWNIWFANIFSQSSTYLPIFLMVYFKTQKFYQFFFNVFAFGVIFKRPLPKSNWQRLFSPMLSTKSFIGFTFTFWSLIHFMSIFYGVRQGSKYIFASNNFKTEFRKINITFFIIIIIRICGTMFFFKILKLPDIFSFINFYSSFVCCLL